MSNNPHANQLSDNASLSFFQVLKSRPLLIILLFSLVLKITVWITVLFANPSSFLWDDAARYHASALGLLRLGKFVENPDTPNLPQYAIPPGYPLVLAATYSIIGEQEEFGVVLNIIFSLATIALIYWIGAVLHNKNVAILAALFLALDFSSFSYSLRLFSETLFALFLTLVLYASIRFFGTNDDKKWIFLIGVFLLCATFIRSIGYYLIIPISLIIFGGTLVKHGNVSKTLMYLSLLIIPFMLFVGVWKIHNYYSLRSWQFCGISGYNMFYYRAAAIVALRDNISLNDARQKLDNQVSLFESSHPETQNWTKGQYSDYWMSQGTKIVLENPRLLIKTEINGIIPMLAGGGDGPVLRMLNYPVYTISDSETFTALTNFDFKFILKRFTSKLSLFTFIYGEFYLVVIYFGMMLWLLSVLSRRHVTIISVLIIVIIMYFLIISAGPESGSRFRVPIMPFFVLLAASGWEWLRLLVTKRRESKLSIKVA